ncbi:MAG: ferredoxin [Chloroflexota bacterium]|jgi:ferredoxin|nr:ferredoxin [Chloroflexota bacterium]
MPRQTDRATIVVDRIRCDGYGMCAELLPEMIELDDWGYPIVNAAAVPDDLLDHARRAVAACPLLALRLRPEPAASMRAQAATRVPAVNRG